MSTIEQILPVLQTILSERQMVEDKMAACVTSINEFGIVPVELAEQYRDEMLEAAARSEEALVSLDPASLVPLGPDDFEATERLRATLDELLTDIRHLRAAHDEVARDCDERGITYAEHLAEELRLDPDTFTPTRTQP